jgi:hypothetical protein
MTLRRRALVKKALSRTEHQSNTQGTNSYQNYTKTVLSSAERSAEQQSAEQQSAEKHSAQ